MFVDQVTINVKAGNGGNGMVAFRREKYEPNGGPAGGDGGRGGSVIFKVNTGLRTLMDFRYNQKFKADSGQNGGIKGMTGRGADDKIVIVPQEPPSLMTKRTRLSRTWLIQMMRSLPFKVVVADGATSILRRRRTRLPSLLKTVNLVKNAESD